MLILCSKNWSLIFAMRCRNTHILWAPHLLHKWCYCAETVTGASWNMHRHLSYPQVKQLPSSHEIISSQGLHSCTMYLWGRTPRVYWIGGWLSPRAGSDAVAKRKNPFTAHLKLNPRLVTIQTQLPQPAKLLQENTVPVLLHPLQIPHGLP